MSRSRNSLKSRSIYYKLFEEYSSLLNTGKSVPSITSLHAILSLAKRNNITSNFMTRETTGKSIKLSSLPDLKQFFKLNLDNDDDKKPIKLHNIFLDYNELNYYSKQICEKLNTSWYPSSTKVEKCRNNILIEYYEFIHKFITYIIYNGNKLYALDYVYEYGGKEDNFFSLRKIYFHKDDEELYKVSNYIFKDINATNEKDKKDEDNHKQYINLDIKDIDVPRIDPTLILERDKKYINRPTYAAKRFKHDKEQLTIDIEKILYNEINIYKTENTDEYLLVDKKINGSKITDIKLLEKIKTENKDIPYNFDLDFINIISKIESDDYFRIFRENNEALLKRIKLFYKVVYNDNVERDDVIRMANYTGGGNKTTYKLYTNKKTNLAYINYNNKKSYFYENDNDNKIYIKIDDKNVYLTKQSISYDEKLNSYFVKL